MAFDTVALLAQIAALEADNARLTKERDRAERMLRVRDRQQEAHRKFLMRDMEEALAGDLRGLRNRLGLMKEGPFTIVQSGGTRQAAEPRASGVPSGSLDPSDEGAE